MFDVPNMTHVTLSEMEANLEAGLYNDVWTSAGTQNRKRAAIRKARKVFMTMGGFATIEETPCTTAEFDYFCEEYLSSGNFLPKSGLKSIRQANGWRKEFRSILDVVSGHRQAMSALRRKDDDWSELGAHLTGKRGAPEILGNYEMISISVVVNECRQRRISIAGLTPQVVAEIAPTLRRETIASFIVGVGRLEGLQGTNRVPAELLPRISREEIAFLVPPKTRRVPPLNPDFAALMEKYIAAASKGRKTVRFGSEERTISTKRLSPSRIKNIRDALRWLWHGLVVLKLARQDVPFTGSALSEPVLVHDLVDSCASGLLGPVSDTQTRRDRLMDVVAFLDWLNPGFREKIDQDFYGSTDLQSKYGKDTADKIRKRKTALAFIRDEEQQRRFFVMPHLFFEEAKPLIASFTELSRADGNGISKTQNRALELAIMAAMTAINTRFPARLKTIAQLEIFGKSPHLLFPDGGTQGDCLVLDIPGRIMKNGRYASGVPLSPGNVVNPRKILRWYIDEVHPLVLKYKHKRSDLRRPDLLFAGLDVETLRRYWRRYRVEANLDLTPHMCRHVLASLLRAKGLAIDDIAELLCISPNVADETYAFVARSLVIQNVMEAQADIYRNLDL